MGADTYGYDRDAVILSREQQAEIGDIFLSARTVSRQMVMQARDQSDEIVRVAHERAEQIVKQAEEQAEEIIREAEKKAADRSAKAQPETETDVSPEMQEYVMRFVGDCFSRLRQQQQETAEFLEDQWQAFLSGMSASNTLPASLANTEIPVVEEVSRQEIEDRVSAIARELMEIIGK